MNKIRMSHLIEPCWLDIALMHSRPLEFVNKQMLANNTILTLFGVCPQRVVCLFMSHHISMEKIALNKGKPCLMLVI